MEWLIAIMSSLGLAVLVKMNRAEKTQEHDDIFEETI